MLTQDPTNPKMFIEPPNKVQSWNERYILIEARQGWNFNMPLEETTREDVEKLKCEVQVKFDTQTAILNAFGVH